jgi:hypothetical protein
MSLEFMSLLLAYNKMVFSAALPGTIEKGLGVSAGSMWPPNASHIPQDK